MKDLWKRVVSQIVLLAAFSTTAGCATVPRLDYEESFQSDAAVAGFEEVRFWGDATPHEMRQSPAFRLASLRDEAPARRAKSILALSGGGSAGAFGAGYLVAWSERGDRPTFDVVTGVSTGALIAPFAFVGTSKDHKLASLFTSGIAKSLEKPVFPLKGLLGESIFDGQPFEILIARYVDADFLREIAREHHKGRRLFVLTTNLDAQRPVVWNMGAIAARDSDDALALFREVLRASASIPGVFPAVRISVVSNGDVHEELHSDGGTATQVFVAPEAFLAGLAPTVISPAKGAYLYIIVNNTLDPEFEVVKDSTLSVASRAYQTFIKTHLRSTINSAYSLTKTTGLKFRLSYVDEQVPYSATDPFNTEYMKTLYRIGYRRGLHGDWLEVPPAANDNQGAIVSELRTVGVSQ